MDEITMSRVTEIEDPKLRDVGMRVVNTLRLVAEKAVAHHAEPAKYPIASETDYLEQIFLARFQALRPEKQQVAVTKVMPLVNASGEERAKVYGDLAKIDLHSAISVQTQVNALPFPDALKFPISRLSSPINVPKQVFFSAGSKLTASQATDLLQLRIHKVQCIDETDGIFGNEGGEDEINLAGITVDATGTTQKISQFRVKNSKGDFEEDDNPVVTYSPPKVFAQFDLRQGDKWPKTYFATLVLAEEDNGAFPDFVSKLYEQAKELAQKEVKKAVEASTTTELGPILAKALAELAAWVVGKLFDGIKEAWEDDVFEPFTVKMKVQSPGDLWNGNKTESGLGWIDWKGHGGEYKLWFDWHISWKDLRVPAPLSYSGVWRGGNDGYYLWSGVPWDNFAAKWDELAKQNLRLLDIETFVNNNQRLWSGIWRTGNDPYALLMGLSWDNFVAKWKELATQNLRLINIETYVENSQRLWAGVWRSGNDGYYLWGGIKWDNFAAKWNELAKQNLRLINIETYVENGQRLWVGVWREGHDGHALLAGLNWNDFAAKWQESAKQNLRLIDFKSYMDNGKTLYAGVWREGNDPYYLWVGASWDSFVAKWDELGKQNLRLIDLEIR